MLCVISKNYQVIVTVGHVFKPQDPIIITDIKGEYGCKTEAPFGKKYFYKWWVKACAKLGIEGVDLYGGTRHSSAIALRKFRTSEEIKRATMHTTNKAFERYFRIESEDLRDIYRDTVRRDEKVKAIKIGE